MHERTYILWPILSLGEGRALRTDLLWYFQHASAISFFSLCTYQSLTIMSNLHSELLPITSSSTTSPEQGVKLAKRQSSWTCRLPVELLSLVMEYLTEDKASRTLATLQSTSRATYTLTTPYLYRNIILNSYQAFDLFGQFDEFPRSENRLICLPVPADTHLLDLHLCQRLRAFFSNTQTVSLELSLDCDMDWFARARFDRYKELVNGLLAFGEPSLWPSLDRCTFNMQPETERRPANFRAAETIPFVDAVFACMYPKHFTVVYFDINNFRDESYQTSWTPCFQRLHADHIELIDMVYGDGMPFASLSLTIHFSGWVQVDDTHYEESDLDSNFQTLDRDSQALHDIEHLKLVGFAGPVDHDETANPHDMTEAMDLVLGELEDIAGLWPEGKTRDLKVTIQSDTSAEGEAGAVSRIFERQA